MDTSLITQSYRRELYQLESCHPRTQPTLTFSPNVSFSASSIPPSRQTTTKSYKSTTRPTHAPPLGDAGIRTPEDVDRRCSRKPLTSTSTDPSGGIVLPTHPYHLVYLRSNNRHVGSTSISHRPEFPSPDIGYTTLEEHANQGYATEAAGAALKWWTEEMKVANIWAGALITNKSSQRVARKIGLVDGGKITVLMPGDLTITALVFVQLHMQTACPGLDGMVLDVRGKADMSST
ncbi:acyl-CoA N-acyltransferase [Exophiala viscosa]|uniref:Acyl-CoA N-acyltransferase n=1 Tax=Exophiala viscosa TaxID=2486360 RepID=A0AAN6IGI8_9EURO|nr:acyl-CoA N-acyltransferase [Exophiala viscosa]